MSVTGDLFTVIFNPTVRVVVLVTHTFVLGTKNSNQPLRFIKNSKIPAAIKL
jgi:hypothetical protein